jgi:hypothetical protein
LDVLRVAAAEAEARKVSLVEFPSRPRDVLRDGLGEPLSAGTKHADLLVVGMPLEAASDFLPPSGRAASASGSGLSLASVLGYGAFRRFGPPVLLVPIVSGRQADRKDRCGPGAVAKASVIGEKDRLVPTRHRW